jgi:hypothetical protein
MEITTQNPSNQPLKSALPPSIELELDLANASPWNLKQAVEKLTSNQSVKQALKAECERLKWLLRPTTRQEIMTSLGKLILHYPQTNMGENQLRLLFEDYLDDLGPYPASEISVACKEYRLNPENRFFPSSGWLVLRVKDLTYPLRHKLATIEKILNAKPEAPKERVPAEEWEKLRRNLGAELRAADPKEKAAATIEAMRKAGAPEADIEAFKAGIAA